MIPSLPTLPWRRRRLARLLWLSTFVRVAGLFAFNWPFQYTEMLTPCGGPACAPGSLSRLDSANLQRSGLAINFYAGYRLALDEGKTK